MGKTPIVHCEEELNSRCGEGFYLHRVALRSILHTLIRKENDSRDEVMSNAMARTSTHFYLEGSYTEGILPSPLSIPSGLVI